MKRIALICFATFLTIPEAAFSEEICGCNRAVPFPGTYKIDFPEKQGIPTVGGAEVIVGADAFGKIGGTITATAPGGKLSLSCVPGGGFAGVLQPNSQPATIAAGTLGGLAGGYTGINGTVPTGLEMSDKFDVIVIRPGMVAAANEVMAPFLKFSREGGPGDMPEEYCQRVDSFVNSAEKMLAAYSDDSLIQTALDGEMAGLQENVQAWPDGSFIGSYMPRNVNLTYDEIVALHIDDGAQLEDGEVIREASEVGASMDPVNCEITPPNSHRASGTCWLSIEIQAMMAHEVAHQNLCKEKKRETGDDNGYLYWTNHPPNQAESEILAYDATLDVLRPWYAKHCN